ncbi:hypothetical protein BTVI_29131 [Pitangus sulphuratus]|nr:hypothetical protein BTVI_29131 [Pitangus sulphuratus]
MYQYMLEVNLLESSSAKDLEVLVDNKLSLRQQCVLVAMKDDGTVGCIRKSFATNSMKWRSPEDNFILKKMPKDRKDESPFEEEKSIVVPREVKKRKEEKKKTDEKKSKTETKMKDKKEADVSKELKEPAKAPAANPAIKKAAAPAGSEKKEVKATKAAEQDPGKEKELKPPAAVKDKEHAKEKEGKNPTSLKEKDSLKGKNPKNPEGSREKETSKRKDVKPQAALKEKGSSKGKDIKASSNTKEKDQKASHSLSCTKRSMDSRLREMIIYFIFMRPHLEFCIQLWGPQHRKDMDPLERVQRIATKIIRGMEHLSYEERLSELELFRLEKRRLWRDLIAAFQYLKETYKKDGERPFTRACSDRTREKGFKLKETRFRLDIGKKFLTVRVVRHWKRLSREAVDDKSLDVSKARLDGALSNLV